MVSALVFFITCIKRVYVKIFLLTINYRRNRDIGDGSPMMLFGKGVAEDVFEFRDSPLNCEHLKYSRLMSFVLKRVEYKVGDFISIDEPSTTKYIYQITSLGYKTKTDLHPEMLFVATTFTRASLFYKNHRHIRPPCRPATIEFIEEPSTKDLKPSQIFAKVSLVPFSAYSGSQRASFFCRYKCEGIQLVKYKPTVSKFCDAFIEQGTRVHAIVYSLVTCDVCVIVLYLKYFCDMHITREQHDTKL